MTWKQFGMGLLSIAVAGYASYFGNAILETREDVAVMKHAAVNAVVDHENRIRPLERGYVDHEFRIRSLEAAKEKRP